MEHMAIPTRDALLQSLTSVIDPELRENIVELGMVRSIEIAEDGAVAITVSLTTAGCPIRNHFQTAVVKAAQEAGATKVSVAFDVLSDTEKGAPPTSPPRSPPTARRSASSTPTSGATRSRACSASAATARRSRPSARSSRSRPTA
jgi:metal-sulfur cluster biosynthetic enzyme